MFTETKNESDPTGLLQQEYFHEKNWKVLNQRMIEKIKLYFNNSPPLSNVLGVKQNSPGLLFLTNPSLGHQELSNPRPTALKKNVSN